MSSHMKLYISIVPLLILLEPGIYQATVMFLSMNLCCKTLEKWNPIAEVGLGRNIKITNKLNHLNITDLILPPVYTQINLSSHRFPTLLVWWGYHSWYPSTPLIQVGPRPLRMITVQNHAFIGCGPSSSSTWVITQLHSPSSCASGCSALFACPWVTAINQ